MNRIALLYPIDTTDFLLSPFFSNKFKIMKAKIFIVTFCIISMPFLLHAQKTSFELAAGISSAFYSMDSKANNNSDFKTGFTGGFAVKFKTGVHWGIQPGLSFVQKGGVETESNSNIKYSTTLNYLELPVNMSYSKRDRWFFGFGPFVAYGLSGKMKAKGGMNGEEDIKFGNGVDELKPFDAGVNLLAGYRLPGNVFFSLNISTSLNNISNDDLYYFSNAYAGIKVGYVFPGKKAKK